jgi:hypothetical protein
MDYGGGDSAAAAATATTKCEYELQLEIQNQRIRELEEELVVSKRLTADLMLNMNSIEQQVNTRRRLSSVAQTTVSANS